MMKFRPVVTTLALLGTAAPLAAHSHQAESEEAFQAELTMERPMAALNTVWMEEMTWLEVCDAMAEGKRTAIVSTGGIEQNGPYVALGKHNYVLQAACEGIARMLGDALCAPIIKLVPEGDISPPTGHMRYPGTLTVRQETFEAMLEDVGRSLDAHGFEYIVYIGDSGGNQSGMENVANELNAEWGETKALYIGEFYDNAGVQRHMQQEFDITDGESDGWHDTFWLHRDAGERRPGVGSLRTAGRRWAREHQRRVAHSSRDHDRDRRGATALAGREHGAGDQPEEAGGGVAVAVPLIHSVTSTRI